MSNDIKINWDLFGFGLSIALTILLLVFIVISYILWRRSIDLENRLNFQKKEMESRQESLIDRVRTDE
jgi:regulatory protein YycH of two-component signal transduction system YycFG